MNHFRHKSEKNEETNSEEEEYIHITPTTGSRSKSKNDDLTSLKSMEAKLSQCRLQDTPKGSITARKSILKTPSSRTATGK